MSPKRQTTSLLLWLLEWELNTIKKNPFSFHSHAAQSLWSQAIRSNSIVQVNCVACVYKSYWIILHDPYIIEWKHRTICQRWELSETIPYARPQGNQRFYQYCTKAAKFNWLHHPSKFAESGREMRQLREGEKGSQPRTSDRAACWPPRPPPDPWAAAARWRRTWAWTARHSETSDEPESD